MSREDQIKKLQSLIEKGITEKSALARELGVSRPTLYTILAKLQEAGMDVFSLAPVIAAPAEPVKPSRRKKPEISKEEKDAKRTTKEVQNNVHQFNRLIDRQINIIEQLNGINERTQIALAEVEAAAKDDKKLLHLVFKGCAEIRSQLEFAADLMKMLYDSQAVQEYQEEVLEVIGSVDMNVRREIERRLAERRALRGAVQLPGAPGGIGPGE